MYLFTIFEVVKQLSLTKLKPYPLSGTVIPSRHFYKSLNSKSFYNYSPVYMVIET